MKFWLRSLLVLCVPYAFAADTWKNFARSDSFYAATLVENMLVLGSDGGVRVIHPDGSSEAFTSADGLEASDIRGVARSDAGELFAVSSRGIVSKFEPNGRFAVLNRSFESTSSELRPGLLVSAGPVLVLGFRDKVAFFDCLRGKSLVSLSRIGNVSLKSTPPSAMLVEGDSLFVALGADVYVRQMNWDALAKDVLLADPASWNFVGTFRGGDSSRASIERLSFSDGSLLADFDETLSVPVALGDTLSRKRFPALWKGDGSLVRQILSGDGFAYLVGKNSAWYYDGELSDVSAWTRFLLENPYVVSPFVGSAGGVTVYSSSGDFGWSDGEVFSYGHSLGDLPYYGGTEPYSLLLKNLATLSDGASLVGIWGFGWRLYSENGGGFMQSVGLENSNCAERYMPNYIVPTGVAVSPDSLGWLVSFWGNSGYGIAYIDESGSISCANGVGGGNFSGPLLSSFSEDGSEWLLYSGAGKTAGTDGTGALDIFRIRPISETGGELVVLDKRTVPTPDNYVLVDMDFDKSGRLWAITNSTFAYFESGMDSVQAPHKTSSYEQSSLSSLSVDPNDRLWIGTIGNGAYMVKKSGASPDTMSATRFASRNGLLDDIVYDVQIDAKKGQAWFVHRNGVTRYARTDLRETGAYMTSDGPGIKVYPNPVRFDLGQTLTFENVSEKATISVYNAGAHLVRFFRGNELDGGRTVWDGRDKRGILVAPGVYHYVIQKGSRQKRGKILVIH